MRAAAFLEGWPGKGSRGRARGSKGVTQRRRVRDTNDSRDPRNEKMFSKTPAVPSETACLTPTKYSFFLLSNRFLRQVALVEI
ncbi:hypothetical protein CEXT_94731 [Caerostris extrusa]|uniref:Uncharacterized protein n=1 Tax=Caerostris extrusa TaxID=172846 RepID=A0AAV4UMP9_CAEEX|nr:hypothetical protein CEXT_94731 [Caerostris extrusa]